MFLRTCFSANNQAMVSPSLLCPLPNCTKCSYMRSCMLANIYCEFPFGGCWVQTAERSMCFVCGTEAAAAAAGPSLPSPRPSIHCDSAGARWKPLAMIYGMSSPGELVEPLPAFGERTTCRRAKPVPLGPKAWYYILPQRQGNKLGL